MNGQHSKEELKQLYSGIKQVRTLFSKLKGEGEHIAIIRPDGSLYMILMYSSGVMKERKIEFFESVQAFSQYIFHVEMMFEYQFFEVDTMMVRESLGVRWLDRALVPPEQLQVIQNSGVSFTRYATVPLLTEYVPFWMPRFPQGSKQQKLLEYVQFVSNPTYAAIILQAMQQKVDVEGIPALVWNEQAQTLYPADQVVAIPPAETNPIISSIFPKTLASIQVPELTVYRFKKHIQAPSAEWYEIMLHVSPVGIKDEQSGYEQCKYILTIVDPYDGIIHLEELRQLNVAQLQECIGEFLMERQETPELFVTSGALGFFIATSLRKLLHQFSIEISFERDLEALNPILEEDLLELLDEGKITRAEFEELLYFTYNPLVDRDNDF